MKTRPKSIAGFIQELKSPMGICLAILGIAAAIPIIVLLVLLIRYSVNVPWWDQFDFVNMMAKVHNGTLSVYDLWVQHNEHRILFPKALTILLSEISGDNYRLPVLGNIIVAVGTYALIIGLLIRTFANKLLIGGLAVIFAWLLFSPIQWINWIWGFQFAFFLGVFFSILTIVLLTKGDLKNSRTSFLAALLACTIATYSLGNGVVIWPIGLALLLMQQASRRKWLTWLIVGAAVIASYLYKFQRSSDSLPILTVIKEPVAVLNYALIYLGRNVANTPDGSKWTGIVLVIGLIFSIFIIWKKDRIDKALVWLGLTSYVILTALLAAASRLNYGINHSFIANSYTTISVIFIISVFALVAFAISLLIRDFKPKHLSALLLIFFAIGSAGFPMVLSYVHNYKDGASHLEDLGRHLRKVRNCVESSTSPNDSCLLLVYPDKKTAWNDIQILRSEHWDGLK